MFGGLLARGYLGRPELTAERFVPEAGGAAGARQFDFGIRAGTRLYRTGDLARWRSDGELEFLGRLDQQVKIRGLRVELGEIEAALAAHPAVREVAVVTAEQAGAGLRLAAFVVARGELEAAELRAFLAPRLPGHMIPAAFGSLAALPLTLNDKVDRAALLALAPDLFRAESQAGEGPRTAVEEVLAGIWAEVLGREGVGLEDDFFALGGHSLLASQVISRVRAALDVELPVLRLFEAPTVAAFAASVEAARRERSGWSVPPLVPLAATAREVDLPLSFGQERLWFLDQLQPDSSTYNMRRLCGSPAS